MMLYQWDGDLTETRPRAYSYVRISTGRQRLGDGVRRQIEISEEYAKRHNLNPDEKFRLHDLGISAFKGANIAGGQLGKFLDAVKCGLIPRGSYLLMESLDRLSRQEILKSFVIFADLINSGINVVTLLDDRLYPAERELELGEVILSLGIMSRARDESVHKSVRISAMWAQKRKTAREKKMTATCPGWLRLSQDRKTFEIIEDRAKVVRWIFRENANGQGIYRLSRKLNQNQTPPLRYVPWMASIISREDSSQPRGIRGISTAH
jgi:DNA invertase Pin-like site-specific DNA recombinase